MLRSVVFVLLSSLGLCQQVTGQLGVDISGNASLRYGIDDFQVTCSPRGAFTQIISYTLLKANGSFGLRPIVSQSYVILSSSVQTTWMDESFETRANLSGIPLPAGTATLVMTIPRDRVTCPDDIGGYVCQFGGANPSVPDETPTTESSQLDVDVLTEPEGVQPIGVTASLNGQQVPGPGMGEDYTFVEGTLLNMSCTATVGNPSRAIRMCVIRMNDSSWTELDNTTYHSGAISPNCQNTMTSFYVYNVTSDDNTTHVLCEVGGDMGCGSGEFNSTLTFYLAGENFTPFPPTTTTTAAPPTTTPISIDPAGAADRPSCSLVYLVSMCLVSFLKRNF